MEKRVTGLALLPCFIACAPGQLRVEQTLAEDADEISFVRASPSLSAHARIGPYRARVTSHASEQAQALVYEVTDPMRRTWTTTCKIDWQDPDAPEKVVAAAECSIRAVGTQNAKTLMKIGACEDKNAKTVLCGWVDAGGTTAELEPQTVPSEVPEKRLHGYHVREPDGVTAAIETLDAGKIWIHRGLSIERRPPVISALYGLFLMVRGAT